MANQILKDSIVFSNDHVVQLEMKKNDKYNSYSVALYCSLIELAQSFEMLSREYPRSGSLAIYRSFLEHYVDLINLRNDGNYINVLDLEDAKSRLKQLKQAKAGNIYMKSLEYLADEKIPEIKQEIKDLKHSLDKDYFSVLNKFQMANMERDYKGLYSDLCNETHSSVSTLVKRHFREEDDKSGIKLVIHAGKKSSSDIFYYGNMAQYLAHAGSMVCQILKSPIKEKYDAYVEKIREEASK